MQLQLRPVVARSLCRGRGYRVCCGGRSLCLSVFAQGRGFAELAKLQQLDVEESKTRKPKKVRQPVEQGKVSNMLKVPDNIVKPDWYKTGRMPDSQRQSFEVHDEEGRERMKASCRLASQVLDMLSAEVRPGVTTDQLDRIAHQFITDNGAYPSPLNYGQFPKSICTSINEIICHGIPDSRQLQDGDIVNIDVTVYLNGYHGDTSRMFYVGSVSEDAKRLCEVCKEALHKAISKCGVGVPYREIGQTISKVADKNGFYVVRDFVGHGVGRNFHAPPVIHHHKNLYPGKMKLHQTFTIEPMLNEKKSLTQTWPDGWTAQTSDHCLSAQWEHTILITENGCDILTKY
eukprot:TRINITY_DN1745_c0_g1_i1.p1 TRINITY_DN1745_c0_g1~~TRINITY_DN1745_c0_g1_i1.p1  ORF type:complete len:366 (-),score=33.87 TRINITY_DN1745_c0_g1_i1:302-1336(-)